MNRLTKLSLTIASATISILAQDSYGVVAGKARDAAGKPLAGITVRLSGPALQGFRIVKTDDGGFYRFALVPPGGGYTIDFYAEGFTSVKKSLDVNLGQTTNADVMIAAVASATVEVEDGRGFIDKTDVKRSTNFTSKDFDTLPRTSRGLTTAALLSPGVTTTPNSSGGRVTVRGAQGFGTRYLLNGVDISDNAFGGSNGTGQYYIDDSVAEIQILQSPVNAKYGGFSGGVVQAITKTGSNSFSGILRANVSRQSWNALLPVGQSRPFVNSDNLYPNPSQSDGQNLAYTAFFSGPIIQDKLWFTFSTILSPGTNTFTAFGSPSQTTKAWDGPVVSGNPTLGTDLRAVNYLRALQNLQTTSALGYTAYGLDPGYSAMGGKSGRSILSPSAGQPYFNTNIQSYYETKLTYSINPDHNINVSVLRNKSVDNARNYSTLYDSKAFGIQTNSWDYEAIDYAGTLSSNVTLELRYGNRVQNYRGGGSETYSNGLPNYRTFIYTNTSSSQQNNATFSNDDGGDRRNSKTYAGNLTYYGLDLFKATHTIEVGFDQTSQTRIAANIQAPFGTTLYTLGQNDDGTYLISTGGGRLYTSATDTYGALNAAGMNNSYVWREYGNAEPATDTLNGAYLNDLMVFNNHHQLMVGVRADQQTLRSDTGAQLAKFSSITPRFQYRYDPSGDQKWIYTFIYADYAQRVPSALANRFGRAGNPTRVVWGFKRGVPGVSYFNPFNQATSATQPAGYWSSVSLAHVSYATLANPSMWDISPRGYISHTGFMNRRLLATGNPTATEKSFGVKHNMQDGFWSINYVERFTDGYTANHNRVTGADYLTYNEVQVSVPETGHLVGQIRENWTNNNDIFRKYRALELEFLLRLNSNFTFGGNWTYASVKGNNEGSGNEGDNPGVSDRAVIGWYEDIHQLYGYSRSLYAPTGPLAEDQTNRGTLYLNWTDQSSAGTAMSASLLMNYTGAAPQSLTRTQYWGVRDYALANSNGSATVSATYPGTSITRPMSSYPNTFTAFFSPRGGFRFSDFYTFDLKANIDYPLNKELRLFTELTVFNLFNHFILTSFSTPSVAGSFSNVYGAATSSPRFIGSVPGSTTPIGFGSYGSGNFIGNRQVRLSLGFKW